MATKTKALTSGTGSVTIEYGGQGDGQITIASDANNLYEARSMQITVKTTSGSPQQTKTITISQAAKVRTNISNAVVTASNQTYNGSAKTPTPTVTLNGTTVPSSGYDVSYSNNINAGTATITVTGKGDYTGTATGTFTIAKASRNLSFNSSYMVLNTSSNGTKTATPSAGSGDGAITYSIANTTYATINSSSGKVTSKTKDGSVTVTATIAEGSNYLGATATYTLYVFATTHNYSYTGSAKSVTLPPGTYQLQVWGAQGASCSDGYAGGKGGYSIGQLTTAKALAIQILVGGQNGYNGGGSSNGSASYSSDGTYGRSSMGNGGGATDIRLSAGTLLSRMIVAGGGSGGAYCYREITTTETVTTKSVSGSELEYAYWFCDNTKWETDHTYYGAFINVEDNRGETVTITPAQSRALYFFVKTMPTVNNEPVEWASGWSSKKQIGNTPVTEVVPEDASYMYVYCWSEDNDWRPSSVVFTIEQTVTTNDSDYQTGYAGGGTTGLGYSNTYKGGQNSAGSGGSFGQGANQTTTNYRYCSGAGGGGWYGGGGGKYSDGDMSYVHYSGGGSGWVNISANAGNRPSGYTGKQLDSGTTYAGNTSFVAPGGGNETGHSGNGYARITRIS